MTRNDCGSDPPPTLLPISTPPGLNYTVLTGTLSSEPRDAKAPNGEPVSLLEVEFPVAHPERPRLLWTNAIYEVEVPRGVGEAEIEKLHSGIDVLVSGQVSERIESSGGHRVRHGGVIVATLVKSGPAAREVGGR
jgi:hypothetical protein